MARALRFLNSKLSFPFLSRRFSSSPLQSQLQHVGFIGLGNMGIHMANNLIDAGYKVVVHDINLNAMKKFSDRGVPTKQTPFEVAESSDVIITMLPSSSHVLQVYTGAYGLLQAQNHLRPWLLIDSSTVDPQTSRRLSAMISKCALDEKKGYADTPVMLDAPVSGGVLGAEAGTLTFMVGGLEEAYISAKPLFLSMGKSTIYCGGNGNGAAAKICNNLAMAVSMLGVSEAFALGQSLGITASTLTKIFNCSSARCWSSDSYNPVPGVMEGVPSSRNYDGGFSSKLMKGWQNRIHYILGGNIHGIRWEGGSEHCPRGINEILRQTFYTDTPGLDKYQAIQMAKDLELAAASAQEVGLKCAFTSHAREIYAKLCEEGHEFRDFSCVFRHYYSGKDEYDKC